MTAMFIFLVLFLIGAVGMLYHHGTEGTLRAVAVRLLEWADSLEARRAEVDRKTRERLIAVMDVRSTK